MTIACFKIITTVIVVGTGDIRPEKSLSRSKNMHKSESDLGLCSTNLYLFLLLNIACFYFKAK